MAAGNSAMRQKAIKMSLAPPLFAGPLSSELGTNTPVKADSGLGLSRFQYEIISTILHSSLLFLLPCPDPSSRFLLAQSAALANSLFRFWDLR